MGVGIGPFILETWTFSQNTNHKLNAFKRNYHSFNTNIFSNVFHSNKQKEAIINRAKELSLEAIDFFKRGDFRELLIF